MLRERERKGEKERHADRQAYTYRETYIDRQTDRQRNSTDTHKGIILMHTRIQGRHSPPPTPVKSHSYTPKIQTIFTLMLSRATKAIKMEFRRQADDGPLLWYLDPLSPHQLKRHEI